MRLTGIHPTIDLAMERGRFVTFPTVLIGFAGRQEHEIRKQLLNAKGCTCARCLKATDFYESDLHHTNPNKKKFTLDQGTIGSIIKGEGLERGMRKILDEAAKTILLCRPCHKAVHAAPHKERAFFDPSYQIRFGAWLPRWQSEVPYPPENGVCKTNPCRWHWVA